MNAAEAVDRSQREGARGSLFRIAWCEIPACRFVLGSKESPDEEPEILVELSSYRISKTPITNATFAAFVELGGYQRAELWHPHGWQLRQQFAWTEPNYFHDPAWSAPDAPVTGVSYWEADACARWLAAELPSEAQWEYAAKGPERRRYPWGEEEPTLELATFAPDCQPLERRGTSVFEHARNVSAFGCLDMAGNLAEWCRDNARPNYTNQPPGPDPVYSTDERAPRIVRGGTGLHDASYLRCTSRDYYVPELRDNLVGFRVVSRGTI